MVKPPCGKPESKQVAYLDVFKRQRHTVLVIASNPRHGEVWRRTDPGAARIASRYLYLGKQVFFHQI